MSIRIGEPAPYIALDAYVRGESQPRKMQFSELRGRWIAFESNRTTGTGVNNLDGDDEIFRMSASGGAQTQLTFNAGFDDEEPSRQPLP